MILVSKLPIQRLTQEFRADQMIFQELYQLKYLNVKEWYDPRNQHGSFEEVFWYYFRFSRMSLENYKYTTILHMKEGLGDSILTWNWRVLTNMKNFRALNDSRPQQSLLVTNII